jgi:hypothetical protein
MPIEVTVEGCELADNLGVAFTGQKPGDPSDLTIHYRSINQSCNVLRIAGRAIPGPRKAERGHNACAPVR